MNATEFINALNDGKILEDREHETMIHQTPEDVLHVITAVTNSQMNADAWAISPNGKAVMIFYKNMRVTSIRPDGFEVSE